MFKDLFQNSLKSVLYIQGGPQKCPYFSLAIIFTKIRKPSRFFLHRNLKFLEKSLLGGVRNCCFFFGGGEGNFVERRRGGGGGFT